jgi:hypothetical protein
LNNIANHSVLYCQTDADISIINTVEVAAVEIVDLVFHKTSDATKSKALGSSNIQLVNNHSFHILTAECLSAKLDHRRIDFASF